MGLLVRCDKCLCVSDNVKGWRKVSVKMPVHNDLEWPEDDEELDICSDCWNQSVTYALHAQ